jgi:tRNA nucleotidyltransferase (CCA-adding enzyme)
MSVIGKRWEHFSHGADIGVRGIGATKAEAFEQAAMALTGVVTEPAGLAAVHVVELECQAPDDELLLMDWLNALVLEMATQQLLFGRFEVRLHNHRLTAKAFGERVDVARHAPAVEVKGATLTGLSVRQEPGGEWVAECVVDV